MAELLLLSGVGLILIGGYMAWEMLGDLIVDVFLWLTSLVLRRNYTARLLKKSTTYSFKFFGAVLLLISVGACLFIYGIHLLMGAST